MTIDSDSNVGINTTSPAEKLDVAGSVKIGNIKIQNVNSGRIGFNRNTANGAIYNSGYSAFQINGPSSGLDYLSFEAYNSSGSFTNQMVYTNSTGRLGIGTTSPTHKLTIDEATGASYVLSARNTNDNLQIKLGTTTGGYANIQASTVNTNAAYNLSLQADGGNVGIGTTAPEEKLHVVGNLKIENGGLVVQNSGAHGYVAIPEGAYYHSATSSVTGAIKITLPVHGTADMLSFVVDIFDYTTSESITVYIKGYLYQQTGSNEWVNLSVQIIASDRTRNYTVRFGADGSNNCVWIGETNTTWTYPQVQVRDFTSGFNTNIDSFTDGWDVSFVTSFDTVDETVINTFPISKEVENSNIRIANSASSYLNGGNVGIGTTSPATTLDVNGIITTDARSSRDKIRVWSSGTYAIGMKNNMTYGAINNNYAMTFQMSNTAARGFWWGDNAHTDAQGAMSLSTTGVATIASSLSIGEGQSETSPQTDTLFVSGSARLSRSVGDTVLTIEADTDNNNENDNPRLELKQDSGIIYTHLGINGDADNTFTGAIANYGYLRGSNGLHFVANGLAMTIDNSNNVGIGTNSPNEKLEINGSIRVNNYVSADSNFISYNQRAYYDTAWRKTSAGRARQFQMGEDSGGTLEYRISNVAGGAANDAITWTSLFRILDSGNVGIAETSPSQKLDVDGWIQAQDGIVLGNNVTSNTVNGPNIRQYGTYGIQNTIDTKLGGQWALWHRWGAAGEQAVGVLVDGNGAVVRMGINRSSMSQNFEVGGSALITGNTLIGGSGSGNIYVGGQTTGQYFRIHHNNSDTYLDANGGKIYFRGDSGANTRFEMDMTGTNAGKFIAAGDVVAFGSPSDKTLKENIKPIENALDKVNKLKGVEFNWKEQGITNLNEDIGFIAQDVQEILPQLVRENENGKLSLRHQGIVPVLVEAIKELTKEIETLKTQINN